MIIYYKDDYNCICAHEVTYAGYNLDLSTIDHRLRGAGLEMYEAISVDGYDGIHIMFVSNDVANKIFTELITTGKCDITEYVNDTVFYLDFEDVDDLDIIEKHNALERRSTVSDMMKGK